MLKSYLSIQSIRNVTAYYNPSVTLPAIPSTLSCWYKWMDSGNTGIFLSPHISGGNGITRISSTSPAGTTLAKVEVYGATAVAEASGGVIKLNHWYHIAAVSAGLADHRLYIDGSQVASSTTNIGGPTNAPNRIVFGGPEGAYCTSTHRLFDPAVWGVALTAKEVQILASGANPDEVQPGSLYLWMTFRPSSSSTRFVCNVGGKNDKLLVVTPVVSVAPGIMTDIPGPRRRPSAILLPSAPADSAQATRTMHQSRLRRVP